MQGGVRESHQEAMRKRRESRADEVVEGLSYRIGYHWWAALFMLAAAGLFVAIGVLVTNLHVPPAEELEVEVVRFGAMPSRWAPGAITVVRLPDGRVGEVRAPMRLLRGCRPGGKIRVIRRGAMLFVHPLGCTIRH